MNSSGIGMLVTVLVRANRAKQKLPRSASASTTGRSST